jgi:hypothetical protein
MTTDGTRNDNQQFPDRSSHKLESTLSPSLKRRGGEGDISDRGRRDASWIRMDRELMQGIICPLPNITFFSPAVVQGCSMQDLFGGRMAGNNLLSRARPFEGSMVVCTEE